MKIAISASNQEFDEPFDPHFGRAPFFCIVDLETEEWEIVPNPAISATGGAGVQAAQFVGEHGAKAVISGSFGPNAYVTLEAAGIEMITAPDGVTLSVSELLDKYKAGELTSLSQPSHDGHRGKSRGAH
jgi:predicted Fe-Mo cluster-binding NifX family protein